ncbi:MAG TPA: WcaF family extracellular polysaccharide biosynthesis acetyltransferase [Nitrolancea sp.]|jgi:putative colanic acid biosynthesis acetyltransferase WcaF|nr:WcaF family extracellular polysaccharide biosynthesis acetyltransferase [Nitrolancea sp.]
MRLDLYQNRNFSRAKPAWIEALWLVAQWLLVRSQIPGSAHRRWVLRIFGARIGKGVTIKPGVRIKFPWRLTVGDHSWLGEDVWIDNLVEVDIGSHCCISQAAFLCTGNHDWTASSFDLRAEPIRIRDGAWIAARSVVAPGVTVGEGGVLAIGSVATRNLEAWSINAGSPAKKVGSRRNRCPASSPHVH